ncbi:peptidase A4 family-domain-containing protein [Xylogone sp. PMI_703]|nr:peptidase A4 family-domain-containing protein [Xylogone sp. PMI_703]
MKVAASVLLLASTALAAPRTARDAVRELAARRGRANMVNSTTFNDETLRFDQQSGNWGGAAIDISGGVTQVSGTFTVPTPRTPSGGSSRTEYCGAAWVGIDGDLDCQAALIQTGVFWCVQGSETAYEAWYEYIPAASVPYSGITVNAGDSITVNVVKTSATSGTTTLINNSNGQRGTHTFTNQRTSLCGKSAEWIVEDFSSGGSLVPFADFGTVTFTGSTAVVNGQTVTAGGDNAVNIHLNQGRGDLTSTTISGSTVRISYV